MDGKGTEMEWRSDRTEMGRRQRVNGDRMEKEQGRDGEETESERGCNGKGMGHRW